MLTSSLHLIHLPNGLAHINYAIKTVSCRLARAPTLTRGPPRIALLLGLAGCHLRLTNTLNNKENTCKGPEGLY